MPNSVSKNSVIDSFLQSRLFPYLVAFTIVSPLVSFQVFYILLGLIYLSVIASRISGAGPSLNDGLTKSFLVALILAVVVLIIHRNNLFAPGIQRTLYLLFIIPVVITIIDAGSELASKSKFAFNSVARLGLFLIFLVVPARLLFFSFMNEDFLWSSVSSLDFRRNPITDYNPNHSDDFFVFGLFLAFLFYSKLKTPTAIDRGLLIAITFLYSFFFVQAGSLGGVLGILVAIVVVSAWHAYKSPSIRLIVVAAATVIGTGAVFGIVAGTQVGTKLMTTTDLMLSIPNDLTNKVPIARCQEGDTSAPLIIHERYASNPAIAHRVMIYQSGLEIWKAAPFFGQGSFSTQEIHQQHPNIEPCVFENFAHVHNLYLDLAIRGGVLLIAFYAISMIAFFWFLGQSNLGLSDFTRHLFLLIAVYILVENLFDLTFIYSSILRAIILAYGLVLGLCIGEAVKAKPS